MKLRATLQTVIVMNEHEAKVMHTVTSGVADYNKGHTANKGNLQTPEVTSVCENFAELSGKAAHFHAVLADVKREANITDND